MSSKRQVLLALLLSSLTGSSMAGEATAPAFVGPGPASEVLSALPQTPGAKGDQERHYRLEEAGREMGYHLYVPRSHGPGKATPLVVALHGYGVNYGFFNEDGLKALDIEKLARVPALVAVGEQETDTVVTSKKAVAALKAAGGDVTYVEIDGGTHASMVAPSTARIMEFFSSRRARGN